jgi:UDP:flavonoid glycosyltransferase YjiC (YdhE family)
MRFLIGGFGTRGDVQPMIALALGLQARGHSVTMVGPPDFSTWAAGLGLRWVASGEKFETVLSRITDASGRPLPRAAFREMKSMLRHHFVQMAPLVPEHDVVVASSITAAAACLAELHAKRYHYVSFAPALFPSSEHPSPFVSESLTSPAWVNRFTWWMWGSMNQAVLGGVVNDERRRLGLAPVRDFYRHMLDPRVILAAEPLLAPVPHDFSPERVVQTGAFFLPERDELPSDLEAFLSAGAAPVYLGFGSMKDKDPKATTRRTLEAIRMVGARVLISRGWAGLGDEELPASARVVGSTPHGKLFPRCAAVVHHGGAGTTMAAARAGVPQVIVPHMGDQFYWGHHIARLGLGPPAIAKRKLKPETLAAAIRTCLEDAGMRERAARFARELRTDGVERAIDFLETGEVVRPSQRLSA